MMVPCRASRPPRSHHCFNFNNEITTRSPARSPPHTALCPCSHVQPMRRAHLLDGAVPSLPTVAAARRRHHCRNCCCREKSIFDFIRGARSRTHAHTRTRAHVERRKRKARMHTGVGSVPHLSSAKRSVPHLSSAKRFRAPSFFGKKLCRDENSKARLLSSDN